MTKYSSLNVVWGKSETNIPKIIYIRQNWLTDDLYDKLENHVKLNESEIKKAMEKQQRQNISKAYVIGQHGPESLETPITKKRGRSPTEEYCPPCPPSEDY
jgi:hypothetical protein